MSPVCHEFRKPDFPLGDTDDCNRGREEDLQKVLEQNAKGSKALYNRASSSFDAWRVRFLSPFQGKKGEKSSSERSEEVSEVEKKNLDLYFCFLGF
jgi:hypothetical protein